MLLLYRAFPSAVILSCSVQPCTFHLPISVFVYLRILRLRSRKCLTDCLSSWLSGCRQASQQSRSPFRSELCTPVPCWSERNLKALHSVHENQPGFYPQWGRFNQHFHIYVCKINFVTVPSMPRYLLLTFRYILRFNLHTQTLNRRTCLYRLIQHFYSLVAGFPLRRSGF
jgi:hypothetical protein